VDLPGFCYQAELAGGPVQVSTPFDFDAARDTSYRHDMSNTSDYLDPARPGAVRLNVKASWSTRRWSPPSTRC